MSRYSEMPIDELRQLSNEKNDKGCATTAALRAQQEIINRNNGEFIGCDSGSCYIPYEDDNWYEKEMNKV